MVNRLMIQGMNHFLLMLSKEKSNLQAVIQHAKAIAYNTNMNSSLTIFDSFR